MELNNPSIQNKSTLLSKRNIIILISLIIIILVIFIISLLMKKVSHSTATTQRESSLTQVTSAVAPSNPFSGGGRYQLSSYSIAYPAGSQNSVYTFVGGSTFIEEPPNYPAEPVLDVEAYTSAQNLTQKENSYLAEGATKSTLVINGTNLPELKNTYRMRTINSKPIHTPTQLRLAYLVKPHSFYVFRMYYSGSAAIPADENLFAQFISSFSLRNK